MSFYLKESLRKDLHAYAGELEDQVHGTCLLTPPEQWEEHIPPAQFDAWITLKTWFDEGEPVTLLPASAGGSPEEDPSSGKGRIFTAPLKDEAMAFRLGEKEDWIVLARHLPAVPGSTPESAESWGYRGATLSCVWSILGVSGAAALPFHKATTWSQLKWPAGAAVNPLNLQPRVLTQRVRTTWENAMRAAMGEFSRALDPRSSRSRFGRN